MCTGLELLAGASSAVGTVSTISSANKQKKEAKMARADAANAENERQTAAAQATQNAYAQQQFAKRALRENSLFTGGGEGRTTLGV